MKKDINEELDINLNKKLIPLKPHLQEVSFALREYAARITNRKSE